MIRINRSSRWTRHATRAFTVRDVVILVGAMAILFGLTAASNGNARVKGQVATCLNNLRQLTRAWHLYSRRLGRQTRR
jgi:hypothetical protein